MIQSIQPFFFGFTKPRFKVSLRATAKAEVGSGLMGMILGWWMGAMKGKKQPAGRKLYTLPLQETTYMTYYIILIPVYCVLLRFGFFFDMVTSVNIWSKLNQVTLGQ